MYYEITKKADRYIFEHVDEDGDRWYLGEAIERVQDEDKRTSIVGMRVTSTLASFRLRTITN